MLAESSRRDWMSFGAMLAVLAVGLIIVIVFRGF